jgi:hypothetical protein
MSIVVTDSFYKGLRMPPDGTKEDATVLDEVRLGLQWRDRPIERTCQIINQFHGPFGGSSSELSGIISKIAGANARLQQMSTDSSQSVQLVQQAISNLTPIVDLINKVTCSEMSTPFLRYFVTECQVLHPDVTAFIHANIDRYPYFQQVSEQIGSHFTIISDINEIDPLFTLECGQLPIENLKTASRMVRSLFSKMFKPTAGNMEDSQKFLDTLSMRAMPCEGNHGFARPHYAKEKPIAHGNDFCMDVFHQQRAEDAIPGVFGRLVALFGDRLRLLNQIFPVDYRVKHEESLYQVPIENDILTVDRLNRVYPPRKMDNDRSLKANEEQFNEDNNG